MTRVRALCTAIVIATATGACSSVMAITPRPRAAPTDNTETVSLSLRVVKDTAARGLEYPKAIEVTLRNDLAGQPVWMEGNMELSPGTVSLELRTEDGEFIPDGCLRNQRLSEAPDYVFLPGGSAITRTLFLTSCYRVPNDELVTVQAHYVNQKIHVPESPFPWARLLRGPFSSNIVQFRMRDAEPPEQPKASP